jgi:hypothetical protein
MMSEPQSKGTSRISSVLEAVRHPIQYSIHASLREYAEKEKDMAHRSELISGVADDVSGYDRLTKVPTSSMSVVNRTEVRKASLWELADAASHGIQGLRRCDPYCESLCELLEDPNGQYKMDPGTAKAVTQRLAQYRREMRIEWWDDVCRRAEAAKRSECRGSFEVWGTLEDKQE